MPLCLPLTNEVGNAIIDYLQSGRPKTKYRELFIRLRRPYIPFSDNARFYDAISYWREIAGIKFRSSQHSGFHSLRHSLATHLLEEDIPFSVIADILGHASMNSTMIYTKSSVETLRQAALSVKGVDHD